MNCEHPINVRRTRLVIKRGYVVRETYCRECRNIWQRAHRALRRAFRQLATQRWVHG